jgi:hypothetical protein
MLWQNLIQFNGRAAGLQGFLWPWRNASLTSGDNCHSGGILFQFSAVLDRKKSCWTFSFDLFKF